MFLGLSALVDLATTAMIVIHQTQYIARRFTPTYSLVPSTGIMVVHNQNQNQHTTLIDRVDVSDVINILINYQKGNIKSGLNANRKGA